MLLAKIISINFEYVKSFCGAMKMPSDCLKVYFGMSEFCRVYLAGFVELLFFDTENADYWCFYGAKVVRNVSKLVPDDAKLVQSVATGTTLNNS